MFNKVTLDENFEIRYGKEVGGMGNQIRSIQMVEKAKAKQSSRCHNYTHVWGGVCRECGVETSQTRKLIT